MSESGVVPTQTRTTSFLQRFRTGNGTRRGSIWAWLIFILGMIYFFLPLIATFEFSLRMIKDQYSFEAYRVAFQDPNFFTHFGYSVLWAILTIVISLLLIVTTAY